MHALILFALAALVPPDSSSDATSEERPILIWVEELPRGELRQISLGGTTADGTADFRLSMEKSKAPLQGSTIGLRVGRHRFEQIRLSYLPFDSVDLRRITTYSRVYPHGRVFRVRIRYGEPAPDCRIGDDGSGQVAITYRIGHEPEIDHLPPARC